MYFYTVGIIEPWDNKPKKKWEDDQHNKCTTEWEVITQCNIEVAEAVLGEGYIQECENLWPKLERLSWSI